MPFVTPEAPVFQELTKYNFETVVMPIVNKVNDTSNNGARATAVTRGLKATIVNANGVLEPAERAQARLRVLINAAEALSARLSDQG